MYSQEKKQTNFINLTELSFIWVLWSIAVVQPIFAMVSNGTTFLVAHGIKGWSLIYTSFALSLFIPLLVWSISSVFGLGSTYGKRLIIQSFAVVMLAVIFLPVLNQLDSSMALTLSFIAAVLIMFLIMKFQLDKIIATWGMILAVFYLTHFLLFSPAKQLLPSFNDRLNLTQEVESTKNTPLFVIVLDELPVISLLKNNGEINETRFPAIHKFVNQSTWYPNAKSISSATNLALPAILSGIHPKDFYGKTGTYKQFEQNLFTLMSNSHEMNVFESVTSLCPSFLCKQDNAYSYRVLLEDTVIIFLHRILPIDLKNKLPSITDRWIGFMQELKQDKAEQAFSKRQQKFNSYIESIEKFPENTVHFLHILLPHAPWNLTPDLKLYGFYEPEGTPGQLKKNDPGATVAHQWVNDEWATELSWRRHLLQTGAVDTLLNQFFEKVKSLGIFDQSMIIILADHGSSFIPNLSRRFAHEETIAGIAGIPMMIKYPYQTTGEVSLKQANNLDVLPTVLDVFGIDYEGQNISGQSLISDEFRTKPLNMFQEDQVSTPLTGNYADLFDQQLKRQNRLFPGSGWTGIFKTERNHSFYRMPVSKLIISDTKTDAVELSSANLFNKSYNKSSNYVPIYYRLKQLLANPKNQLLVSVNDEIVSQCHSFVFSSSECAGLIDPQFLYSTNSNENLNLRFFTVESYADGIFTVNELLPTLTDNVTLLDGDSNTYILFDSVDKVRVKKEGSLYGTVSLRLNNNQSTYQLYGWAGDTSSGIPAEEVLLFVDGQLTVIENTGVKQPYLVDQYGHEGLATAGYYITIPIQQIPNIESHELRLFAKDKSGNISELNYYPNEDYKKLFKAFDNKNNRVINKSPQTVINSMMKQNTNQKFTGILDVIRDDSQPFISGDWFEIHNHTRWIGSHAHLLIPETSNQKVLTIDMAFIPFIRPGLIEKQTLEIYVNEVKVDELELVERTKYNQTIRYNLPPNISNEPLHVELKSSTARSPAEIGESSDNRKLSLFLLKFIVSLE